jgi:PAS domain S-box-containing protein
VDSAEAAFYDTAVELSRKAEEEQRAAQSHLDAAHEYERLADAGVKPAPAGRPVRAEAGTQSPATTESDRWQASTDDAEKVDEGTIDAPPVVPASHSGSDVGTEDQRARFFEYSRDMLCTAGFDGYFKLLNEAWEHTLGYAREELLSQPYMDLVHPADVERTQAEAASLSTAGVDTVQFRNRYRAKDGSYRWLEWNSRADLEAGLVYAVARDVTDQQRTAEVEARLSAIVRSSNDAIYGLSPQGSITSWNSGAERMYGYRVDEIVGQPLSRLVPPDRADEDRVLLERVLRGETVEHFQTDRRKKDGTTFQASVSMSQVLDAQSRITGASVTSRAIGQRR